MSAAPNIRIAYLVSQYPAVNHTFILREILELRRLGFEIHVASIRAPSTTHLPFFRRTRYDSTEELRFASQ